MARHPRHNEAPQGKKTPNFTAPTNRNMKHFIATMALVLTAVCVQAQKEGSSTASNQAYSSEAVASQSAGLKESYGLLSRELAHLGREIGPDANAATSEQKNMKARIERALEQLESLLGTVNDPSMADQWTEVLAKSEMVRNNATAILEERKAKR